MCEIVQRISKGYQLYAPLSVYEFVHSDQHLWCSYFPCSLIENFANVNDNTDQQRRLKELPSKRMGTEHFIVDRGGGWAVTKQISAQEKCKEKSGHRESRDKKKI